jgi:hypothetical protein
VEVPQISLFQFIKCSWFSSVDIHKMYFTSLQFHHSMPARSLKIPWSEHDPQGRRLTNAVGFKVKSATKWQCTSFKLVQKMQQHSILFSRNSHLTLYIHLLVYFASILHISIRYPQTSFFQRFKPLKLLYVHNTSCLMGTHLKS